MVGLYLYFSFGLFFWITAIIVLLRSEEKAFYFLAGHFFILGVGIFSRSLIYNGLILSYPHFYGILNPLQFLYGPFFFFYLSKLFDPKYQFKSIYILHFVPFLFNFIDYTPFFVLSPIKKISIISNAQSLSYFGITNTIYEYLKVVSYGAYLLWGIRFYLLYIYYTKVPDNRNTVLLHYWIRSDLFLKAVAICSYFSVNVIFGLHSFTIFYYFFSLDAFLNAFIIFLKPALLKGIDVRTSVRIPKPSIKLSEFFIDLKRQVKLSSNENDIKENIQFLFDAKQLHCNPDFDADLLKNKIGTNSDFLEKNVQKIYSCSVADLIQFKRLEILMEMQKGKSINEVLTSILYNAGFNSITSLQGALHNFYLLPNKAAFTITEKDCQQLMFLIENALIKLR